MSETFGIILLTQAEKCTNKLIIFIHDRPQNRYKISYVTNEQLFSGVILLHMGLRIVEIDITEKTLFALLLCVKTVFTAQ